MQDIGMQFHIRCKEGDVGRYVFLPGDPGRCEAIAALFDNPVHVAQNREYNIYTGTLLGENAAIDLMEGRKGKHFISIEEVTAACPKVSKTHVQMLKDAGAFGDLPDTSQVSLF